MKTAHTPTPWKVKMYVDKKEWASFAGLDGFAIGDTNVSARSADESLANAALIVKAVNSHSSLVATLHHIQDLAEENTHSVQDGYCQIAEWARNQIAKAEGK